MNRVLVVDDSLIDRRLVEGLLKKDPEIEVEFAENGAVALKKLEQHRFDLVLTDLMMPEIDGLELVDRVRKQYPLVPTVLMTSKGNEEIAVQALQHGAASYVPKRSLAQELLETVYNVISLSGQQRGQTRLMECITRSEQQFILQNERPLLSSLVGYIQEIVSRLGLCDEADRMRIGVALEEALVNALFHGNLEVDAELREQDYEAYHALAEKRRGESPYRDRRIFVDAVLSPDEATFVIRDEGPGFDPDALPDPTDPANLERVSGRGVLLMRTFMDSVTYNEVGNEVSLVKRRSSLRNGQQDK